MGCNVVKMTSEETISVIIDGTAPKVAVSCVDAIVKKGPGVQTRLNLKYAVHDNCGGELDVQVKSYANE